MSTVNPQIMYNIQLTQKEFTLVVMALSGRLKKDDQIEEAELLATKLQEQKVAYLRSILEISELTLKSKE